jgi:hypothetical protein
LQKPIINYIHREGTKEPGLIANGLQKGVLPMVALPPKLLLIKNPDNRGAILWK